MEPESNNWEKPLLYWRSDELFEERALLRDQVIQMEGMKERITIKVGTATAYAKTFDRDMTHYRTRLSEVETEIYRRNQLIGNLR